MGTDDKKNDTPLVDFDSPNALAGPSTLPSLEAVPLLLESSGKGSEDLDAKDRSFPQVLEGIDFLVPEGGEEPPPEFTPYEAEYFATSNGDIVSHDKHLNEDGRYICCVLFYYRVS